MSTTKSALWTTGGALANLAVKLGSTAVLARLLSPEDFGLVALATGAIALLESIGRLGVAPAIIQRPQLSATDTASATWLSAALGALLATVIFATSDAVASFFSVPSLADVLRALSPIALITGIGAVPSAILQREMRFRALSYFQVTSYVIGSGAVTICLALLGFGYWSLVIGLLAGSVLHMAFVVSAAGKAANWTGRITWAGVTNSLSYGFAWTLGEIGNALAKQADKVVAGRLLGAEATGLYSRAYTAISAPTSLLSAALDRVLFAALARRQGSQADLRVAFSISLSTILTIALPASALLYVLAPEIVSILFGTQWGDAILPFQMLALGLAARVGYKTSEALARATASLYARAWRQYVFALAVVCLGGAGGVAFGLPGLAAGVSAAFLANYGLMLSLSARTLQLRFSTALSAHVGPAAFAGLAFLVALLIALFCRRLDVPSAVTVAVVALASTVSHIAIAYAFRFSIGAPTARLLEQLRRAAVAGPHA